MTYLDPNSFVPQYHLEDRSDRLRACWPGLVAIARTERATKDDVFHELAPLPGGFFVAGAGEARAASLVRSDVMAHLVAGTDLKEALWRGLGIDRSDALDASACYTSFDPVEATFRLEGVGSHLTAVHFTTCSIRLLHTSTEREGGTTTLLTLRPGEALALIAHPRAWSKQVLSAMHGAWFDDAGPSTPHDLDILSAAVDEVAGPSASVLLLRQDAAGTPDGDGGDASLTPTTATSPPWTPEDAEFLERLMGCPA